MPRSRPIYKTSQQKKALSEWSEFASKDVYLHDQQLDQSGIYEYPEEEPENMETSWIKFDEQQEEDPSTECQNRSSAILDASLSTIFKRRKPDTIDTTTTNSSVEVAPKRAINRSETLDESIDGNQFQLILSPHSLLIIIGVSFSLGYFLGILGYRIIRDKDLRNRVC